MLQNLFEPIVHFLFIIRLVISFGVVIMIHTGLIKLWNLQLMWGFHHLFQSLKFYQHALLQRNVLDSTSRKIAEELGFERREESCL